MGLLNRAIVAAGRPVSIAPLVTFRILFGALMAISAVRFMALGWVEEHFGDLHLTFKYYGFAWVEPLSVEGMYGVYLLMLVASIGVLVGAWYRASALLLFCTFTYAELTDITYYLNHYYLMSLVAAWMILLPAHKRFSLDVRWGITQPLTHVSAWCVLLLQAQLAIVYTTAGLMKINPDWMLEALPLKIWLPAHTDLPWIGPLLAYPSTAYVFSWFGMFYDTTIVGWLLWRPTRLWAYIAVVVFHCMTGLLFPIGIFPIVMIGVTLIYFSPQWHQGFLAWLGMKSMHTTFLKPSRSKLWIGAVGLYLAFQLLFPWRFVFYPNNLFWSEEGYRFGWRVMLMEKAGTATFYVKDSRTGREGVVDNQDFLNEHQEKQMAMQPDLILQAAHFLGKHYAKNGVNNPTVRAEVYVTLNGRPSQLLIDPTVNLMQQHDGWTPKKWVRGYKK